MKYPSLQEKYFRALEERDEARKLARQFYWREIFWGKISEIMRQNKKLKADLDEAEREIVWLKSRAIFIDRDYFYKRTDQLEAANARLKKTALDLYQTLDSVALYEEETCEKNYELRASAAAWKRIAKYRHARTTCHYSTMRWFDQIGYLTADGINATEQRRREKAKARIDKHASITVDEIPY